MDQVNPVLMTDLRHYDMDGQTPHATATTASRYRTSRWTSSMDRCMVMMVCNTATPGTREIVGPALALG